MARHPRHSTQKKTFRLANTTAGHRKLVAMQPSGAHVILEATGGYEQALWLALLRAGKTVSKLNPTRVRHFAKASMKLAKTDAIDAIDAAVLARSPGASSR